MRRKDPATPRDVLRDVFGFESFRPGQEVIIDTVMQQRDCIGVMPTGSGKSLTFQIPARLVDGTVLVISPLISLMKDQVDALEANGFRATTINSSVDFEERRERLRQLRAGELELVYIAPEALDGWLRDHLSECRIALWVVDEAHCISQWGHDFRPSYRRLRGLREVLGEAPVLALTATATRRVCLDILKQLGMKKPGGFKGSFYRSNLRIWTRKKGEGNTRREILGVVHAHRGSPGIIYCLSRKSVESTARFLQEQGVRALPYHAGMEKDLRTENQSRFARDECEVIVATVAFGMGIDKSNVRYVVHRDLPKNIEAWAQEIGRAGRDGEPADCVLFYSWADVIAHERFLDSIEDPTFRAQTHLKTKEMFDLADRGGCRHRAMVSYFDEEMEDCGVACDRCTEATIDQLLADVPDALLARSRRKSKTGKIPAAEIVQLRGNDRDCFLSLKELRKSIADDIQKPAYIVFSDAVLRRIAQTRPSTEVELLAINGVGPAKVEAFGCRFLQHLAEVAESEEPEAEPATAAEAESAESAETAVTESE